MDRKACRERFYQLVSPSLPNEWEVEEILDSLSGLRNGHQERLLAQIPVIWPISHSLCLSFLEEGSSVIEAIPVDLVPQWVRTILRSYEKDGLASARQYISEAEDKFLQPLKTRNLVRFEDISVRMLYYIRGISGQHIEVEKEVIAHTDSSTIYIPATISVLPDYRQNQLLYKFLLSLHWGFIRLGTFKAAPSSRDRAGQGKPGSSPHKKRSSPSPAEFLAIFDEVELAADLFFLLETGRVMAWLREDLPGLVNRFTGLRHDLSRALEYDRLDRVATGVTELALFVLFADIKPADWLRGFYPSGRYQQHPPEEMLAELSRLYDHLTRLSGTYVRPPLLNLLGKHDFSRAAAEIEKKRARTKEAFILQLRTLQKTVQPNDQSRGAVKSPESADQTILVVSDDLKEQKSFRAMTILDNPEVQLPEELNLLIAAIKDDLGHIPPSYFSAASGVAGKGFSREAGTVVLSEAAVDAQSSFCFDEWDFRRGGYRKNWCQLQEKPLPVVDSTFVSTTLAKHRGLLLKLRKQFEYMKTAEHFVRRQREGVDLDLDAIVEARGDQRAGIGASEKLFVRLLRNERDIATVFLVDMSNSTEGWVGNVIKEALVLLCEVMDVAGDPYGILGFSGMRRSRCEIYPIKQIEEPYNHLIHQRINSITPREYTRMGPAIRYATRHLKACEARTRLLVTITDGKPEDYDDYKGEYAIEDTRKALMETRGCGMHAFCITVDREAHDYLPLMFGRGNYIFIDDIQKLPVKMVDMYRLLTT